MRRRRATTCVLVVATTGAALVGCEPSTASHASLSGELLGKTTLVTTIGEDEAAGEEYQFGSISCVMVAPNGDVWVVDVSGQIPPNIGKPLVRLYDSTGVFLRVAGGEGSGPGEYRLPYDLAVLPDGRVAMRDARFPGRITLYTPEGELDTTWSLSRDLMWPYQGADGIEVDTAGIVWLPFEPPTRPPAHSPKAFLRVWPDGSVADTVPFPELPAVEGGIISITKRLPGGGTSRFGLTVPYAPVATWSWSPVGGFAVARTDTYAISLHVLPPPRLRGTPSSKATGTSMTFRRDVQPIPVSKQERAAASAKLLAQVLEAGGGRGDVPELSESKPPVKWFWFSEDARLVVRVSTPSARVDGKWVEANVYDVFEPDGTFRGRVVLPASFSPVQMKGDRLWGVYRDSLDVQSVRRYDITWPDANSAADR